MKSIYLTENEIQQLNNNEKLIFIRMLKEQPPEEYIFKKIHEQGKFALFVLTEKNIFSIPLQYPIGTVIGIKETYCNRGFKYDFILGQYIPEYCYKSKGKKPQRKKWLSPVTMPQEAIRTKLKAVGNSVKRVQAITTSEAIRIGIYYSQQEPFPITRIKDWFNSKYAKKGYKWEDNPYCEIVDCEVR